MCHMLELFLLSQVLQSARSINSFGSLIIPSYVYIYEQWKKPSCLGYTGDYTIQLEGDYNKPLQALLNNPYNGT